MLVTIVIVQLYCLCFSEAWIMGHSLGHGLRGWEIFFLFCFFVLSDKRRVMSLISVVSQKLFFNNAVAASLPFLQDLQSQKIKMVNFAFWYGLHMSEKDELSKGFAVLPP